MAIRHPAHETDKRPLWPACGHGAGGDDPIGCRGREVARSGACLAHMPDGPRAGYFAGLTAGDPVDHRGTTFTRELLDGLLTALTHPSESAPRFGPARLSEAVFEAPVDLTNASFRAAWFDKARFRAAVRFNNVVFGDAAHFSEARFEDGVADFRAAVFGRDADFTRAAFTSGAWFDLAGFGPGARFTRASFGGASRFRTVRFGDRADFREAGFSASVDFTKSAFGAEARFTEAEFAGEARFGTAAFSGHARFNRATFRTGSILGPLLCAGTLDLGGTVFCDTVTLSAAASAVRCRGTRWDAKASLRLRYASVDLADAAPASLLGVSFHPAPFHETPDESVFAGRDPRPAITSLSGADASNLALADTDLTACVLTGTANLDKLRLDGETPMARPPRGLQRSGWRPVLWSSRKTLAEEQHWRASRGATGWAAGPPGAPVPRPATLAVLYRRLRKSLEDGKNEPEAADFYYGEMEMRRHDQTRPLAERALMLLYWAVSGYSLRALRAVGWLAAAMLVSTVLLALWGLPQRPAQQVTTGTISGTTLAATTVTPLSEHPTGPWSERLSARRLDRALRVTIGSGLFRSSGQNLTPAGTYIDSLTRCVEPVLLAFAVLAVRNRVKR
ncbi:pentapeptide repeat-containing protein [Kitasatospora sp. NPDC056273]|uniref:pentapeptide repeat-containing protein n=1 Tax=Kitasatospora sp. NPDC056273 TaxID=3345769 RepID=UPI0035D7EE32